MSLQPFPSANAIRIWLSPRGLQRVHLLWAGEALFVAGWSLMWASSLALTPWMPVRLCVGLMIAGLALFAAQTRKEPRTGR